MVLIDLSLHSTRLGSINRLCLEGCAFGTHATRGIHSLLERSSLPSENVISVLAQSSRVALAEDERLASVRWPVGSLVKWCSIPDNLQHDLWNSNRVGRWASSSQAKEVWRSSGRIRNMVLMIWGVKIYTVPAAKLNFSTRKG
jgi:hypothetical protein